MYTSVYEWSGGSHLSSWKLTHELLCTFASISGAFHTFEDVRSNWSSSTDDPIRLAYVSERDLSSPMECLQMRICNQKI